MQPFLDEHLKDGAPQGEHAAGVRLRDRHQRLAAPAGVAALVRVRLCLAPRGGSTCSQASRCPSARPRRERAAFDEYVSDPAKPVPYQPRPVHFADAPAWQRWLLNDQRFVADRPDVLELRDGAADRAAAHRRGAAGEPVRLHQRHRQ